MKVATKEAFLCWPFPVAAKLAIWVSLMVFEMASERLVRSRWVLWWDRCLLVLEETFPGELRVPTVRLRRLTAWAGRWPSDSQPPGFSVDGKKFRVLMKTLLIMPQRTPGRDLSASFHGGDRYIWGRKITDKNQPHWQFLKWRRSFTCPHDV